MRARPLDKDERDERGGANQTADDDTRIARAISANLAKRVDRGRESQRDERKAGEIELARPRQGIVIQKAYTEGQPYGAKRDIDEEDPLPGLKLCQVSTDHRPQRRRNDR